MVRESYDWDRGAFVKAFCGATTDKCVALRGWLRLAWCRLHGTTTVSDEGDVEVERLVDLAQARPPAALASAPQ